MSAPPIQKPVTFTWSELLELKMILEQRSGSTLLLKVSRAFQQLDEEIKFVEALNPDNPRKEDLHVTKT